MTIYNLYIFDRDGQMLYYGEWTRKKQSGMSREEMSPVDLREGYLTYCTNKYRLHLFETPSRVKFVLNTDVGAQGIKELLHQIFTQVSRDMRERY
ncbi:Trafficking protein particle complex subunit 1 [Portunus trituberculatus]|uniref:Trafficking protein particle complex subunit n=1 Tax=Portunus trituberculatus TaxID=210409 RepID=A0A5B7HKH5_PORTR|nr:Trafficking protein particle complex subunit 1 [Portunus trituberculatus]